MRKAIVKGVIIFVALFLLLSLATKFALDEGENALSLFAGAALSNSAKDKPVDTPAAAEEDLAVLLKERPDELITDGTRFLIGYGYLPDIGYINRHKLVLMNVALAFIAGLLLFILRSSFVLFLLPRFKIL
jgi:hypothetical protein